jgi:hypothetical protein
MTGLLKKGIQVLNIFPGREVEARQAALVYACSCCPASLAVLPPMLPRFSSRRQGGCRVSVSDTYLILRIQHHGYIELLPHLLLWQISASQLSLFLIPS